MPRLSEERVLKVLGALYQNSQREKQKSLRDVSKQAEITVPQLMHVRNILASFKILSIVGTRAKQCIYWEKEKAQPNQSMARLVYKTMYHKDNRVEEVKVSNQRGVVSLKRAMDTLAQHGYRTLIKETKTEYGTCVETIDLSQFV